MADPSLPAKIPGQESPASPGLHQTLMRESIPDSLKLILIGAPWAMFLRPSLA
jgi:hypothetical protein